MRIVSLLPSATEIVFALGLDQQLCGVTDECDWPRAARAKRIVVRSRQPAGLAPREIDAWVRTEVPNGGLYRLDEQAIAEIGPELVLTQDLCRVCAVPTGDVDAALERVGCPSVVVTLEPNRLDEVIDSVETVAGAAGAAAAGRRLAESLRSRLAAIERAVRGRPPVPTLVLEWLDPPFLAGHWVPDVVSAAGGLPLLGDAGGRSRSATWDEVRASRPEVVVLAPCGLLPHDAWRQVSIMPDGILSERTFATDLARPGPRLVDAVEALAAVLHPGSGLPLRPDVLVPRPQ
ncbi:MAG: ABC transporter substrate-binding protein [Chloroflexota bacterium]|nr:ABC transporter substrate-binding protein [Chloroflexota bacterium]